MTPFNPLDSKADFPKMEEQILKFWKENDLFRKSIELRKDAPSFTFYDGPPFATGLPHYGHILAGTIKDVIPRYQTMLGKKVDRRFGWDCHGVPVEHEMEKKLGFKNADDIENYGIKEFCEACRGIVLKYTGEWQKTVERMGRWVDFENSYRTMDAEYMESIIGVFKKLWEKGLIYEGKKVVAYSPKLGSPLSNFEANLNYKDIDDPAVTVKFELEDEPGTFVLAWTTTPWTLPSNLGLCSRKNIKYVFVQEINEENNERYIVALNLVNKIFSESFTFTENGAFSDYNENIEENWIHGKKYKVNVCHFSGKELIGKKYKPLFPFFKNHKNAFHIFGDDFVSDSDGTGIVHLAPTGEDDARILSKEKVELLYPFTDSCYFDFQAEEKTKELYAEMTDVETQNFASLQSLYFRKDSTVEGSDRENANKWVLQKLRESGKMFKEESIKHSYPHCWRTDCALMYRGIHTFFVDIQKIKKQLVEKNQDISWVPKHIRDGRFGKLLENAPDWAISRNRYWGAPIPLWNCKECGHKEVAGTVEEIAEKALKKGKLFVVRHGEAEHNVKNVISSKRDDGVALTQKGIQQAQQAGKNISENIDLIITSPLLRAQQTAENILAWLTPDLSRGLTMPIIEDDRIREIDAGKLDGKSIEEWRSQFSCIENRFTENPHQGESTEMLMERVTDFIQDIQEKYAGKNILIVSHGGVVHCFLKYFHNTPHADLFQNPPKNAHLHEFSFSGRPENDNKEVDLHKPYLDKIEFKCPKCQGTMKRVEEVLDCWFESGAMPYASNGINPGKNDEVHLEMRSPKSAEDWAMFHDILRKEIFEKYNPEIEYDSKHPDLTHPHNHPKIFVLGEEIIGAVRLDEMSDERLALRTFAILPDQRKKGYGRIAMNFIEDFAIEKGKFEIVCNSQKDVVSFYEHFGFEKNYWEGDVSFDSVPMGKNISQKINLPENITEELKNISEILETVTLKNYAKISLEKRVGTLPKEAAKVMGVNDQNIYLSAQIYAKIRGWTHKNKGHDDIQNFEYYLIPFLLHNPTIILEDKKSNLRFLICEEEEKTLLLVVDVEGGKNEIVSYFYSPKGKMKGRKVVYQKKESPEGRPWGIPSFVCGTDTSLRHQLGRRLSQRSEKFSSRQALNYSQFMKILEECQIREIQNLETRNQNPEKNTIEEELKNISEIIKTVTPENYEEQKRKFYRVGTLPLEVQKVLNLQNGKIYMDGFVYAKIRNWAGEKPGHTDMEKSDFYFLPALISKPYAIYENKKNSFLYFLYKWNNESIIITCEKNEKYINLINVFDNQEKYLEKLPLLWKKESIKRDLEGRAVVPSCTLSSLRKEMSSLAARFSSCQVSQCQEIIRFFEEKQMISPGVNRAVNCSVNSSFPFPADFIAEGLDQTRGWFYTLHVLGNALYNSPATKNIIVNGIVLAEDGQKMSKSKKNYPDPSLIFDKFGADPMRFYLMNSPVVRAEDLRFSEKGVEEVLRKVFLPLWNAYSFFVTYANIDEWKPEEVFSTEVSNLTPQFIENLIQKANTPQKKEKLFEYFKKMWKDEFNFEIEKTKEEFLQKSQIFYFEENDEIKGAVEITSKPQNILRICRIGVKKEDRKKDIGKKLMKYVFSFAQKNNIEKIILTAALNQVKFYKLFHFKEIGKVQDMNGINCIDMEFVKISKMGIPPNELDAWILAEIRHLIEIFTEKLDAYEIENACKEIPEFLDKLTNFYIRRSRRRFWKSEADDDKNSAFQTLYTVLKTFAQILAPISPFLTETIWQNFRNADKSLAFSIHHSDFPKAEDFPKNEHLRTEIEALRNIVSLALAIRAKKKIRVRQPLGKLKLALPPAVTKEMVEKNTSVISEEVNVKEIEFVKNPEELAETICKPNARLLGPKFGKDVQHIIREAKTGNYTENPDGTLLVADTWTVSPEEVEIGFLGKEGLDVESGKGIVVALDTEITQELKNEGMAREIIRHIQDMRKEADYEIADRIKIFISGSDVIKNSFGKMIQEEVLAEKILDTAENFDAKKEVEIEGEKIVLGVKK